MRVFLYKNKPVVIIRENPSSDLKFFRFVKDDCTLGGYGADYDTGNFTVMDNPPCVKHIQTLDDLTNDIKKDMECVFAVMGERLKKLL